VKKPPIQYTLRNIPERVDARLRETATQFGVSLNTAAVDALARALGIEGQPVIHHDLDDLAGTWIADPDFDRALAEMDRVDPDLWR
jgi:hypothetical protein